LAVISLLFRYSFSVLVFGAGLAGTTFLLANALTKDMIEEFGETDVFRHYYLWLMLYAVPMGVYVFDLGFLLYNYVALSIATILITAGLCSISNI
jgi:hypothetical protein